MLCHNKGRRESEREGREIGGGRGPKTKLCSGPKQLVENLSCSYLRAPKTAGSGEWRKRKKHRGSRYEETGRRRKKREKKKEGEEEKEAESLSLKQKAVIRLAVTLTVTSGNDRSSLELRASSLFLFPFLSFTPVQLPHKHFCLIY